MRIFEIDDQDRIRAVLSGINLDIDSVYADARLTYLILSRTSDPIMKQVCIDKLNEFSKEIQKVIDTEFTNDRSTVELKHKAQQMIVNIQKYL